MPRGATFPGRLGRRSPLYHPFVFILITLLVVVNVAVDLFNRHRPSITVGGVAAGDEVGLVVSRTIETPARADADREEAEAVSGRHGFRRLDGDPVFRGLGDGFVRAVAARGRRLALLFDDKVVEYDIGKDISGFRDGEAPRKIGERPFDVELLGLDVCFGADDEPLVVACDRGESPTLYCVEPRLGDWDEREVATLPAADTVRGAIIFPLDGPTIAWTTSNGNELRFHQARRQGIRFVTSDVVHTIEDGPRCRGLVGFHRGSLRGAAFLVDRARGLGLTLWTGAPGADGLVWSPGPDRDLAMSGPAAVGLIHRLDGIDPESIMVAGPDGTRVVAITDGRDGPGLGEVRHHEAVMTGSAARTAWFLALYLPALIALVIGIVEAIKHPVLSEPSLRFPPAPFFRRMAAFLIDASVGVVLTGVAFWALGWEDPVYSWRQIFQPSLSAPGGGTGTLPWAGPSLQADYWMFLSASFLLTSVLAAALESRGGRTLGKLLVRVRVTQEASEAPPSFLRALSRRFLLLVDLVLFTLIFAFLNPRSQRLGDIVSRTMVIDELAPPYSDAPPPPAS